MEAEHDLKKLKRVPNPYVGRLTTPITIKMSNEALEYFRSVAKKKGIKIETLINFYLLDCAKKKRFIDEDE
jgi:hypothetical protein